MMKRDSHEVRGARGTACPVTLTPEQVENRGLAWVVGAFLICPCHLPLSLWLATTLLAGTAAGALVHGHPFITGTVMTLAWLAATWHGIRLMRAARAYAGGVATRAADRADSPPLQSD